MKRLMTAVLCLGGQLGAQTGLERLRQIRNLEFPAELCYRIRDVFLEREDFKLHFSDGYLLFARPVAERTLAAVFLAASETGEGEIILIPPSRSERQSMARFLGAPVLQENIRTAMLFFTDDTEAALRRALAQNPYNQPDPEAGRKLAPDWGGVARNLIPSYELRMLVDSISPLGAAPGFFAAAVSGLKLGRFDILVDPRRQEQLSIGQVVWQDAQRFYDVWAAFPARSFREGRRKPFAETARLENYRLEADLSPELDMRVTARAELVAGNLRERVIALELSRQMRVSRLLLDGQPVEFLQNEALDSSGVRRRGNDWLMLVLEAPLEPGSRHAIEFEYGGNVITEAGRGVYYVGARGSWYPSRGFPFTQFDLLFRYPRRLQLVATGRQIETSVEGDVRTTRWKPEAPIRVAGFNLGDFERTSLRVGDYTVEVCANKNLEAALQLPTRMAFLLPPVSPALSPRPPGFRPLAVLPMPEPELTPTPARRLDLVARESAQALEFYISRFGPPPLEHLTISPIPGRFGQGFPGLVYLSTLSYYQPEDKPLEKLKPSARQFFSEQLLAHEIAHQWWGNLVASATYHDDWLMESLADYSALLFLEHQKGAKALEGVLDRYRGNLLSRTESGETVESAGAIVLGDRLRTSRNPKAQHTITYEKGAWVLHMLRRLLGDDKFFALLVELRRRYQYQAVSTEQFRSLAARFLPPLPQDPNLENFFHQWVYSTGIPTLKLEYRISGKIPRLRLAGVVRQSGVPQDFSVPVPIEITLPGRGEKSEILVHTAEGEASFTKALAQKPARVTLDPRDAVLAVKH